MKLFYSKVKVKRALLEKTTSRAITTRVNQSRKIHGHFLRRKVFLPFPSHVVDIEEGEVSRKNCIFAPSHQKPNRTVDEPLCRQTEKEWKIPPTTLYGFFFCFFPVSHPNNEKHDDESNKIPENEKLYPKWKRTNKKVVETTKNQQRKKWILIRLLFDYGAKFFSFSSDPKKISCQAAAMWCCWLLYDTAPRLEFMHSKKVRAML